MEDELLDSEDKQKAAVSGFTGLLNSPGWQLLVKMLEANIEVLKTQILAGINSETGENLNEVETNRLRDDLKVYQYVKDLPGKVVKQYTDTPESNPSVDPYFNQEQLEKAKKR